MKPTLSLFLTLLLFSHFIPPARAAALPFIAKSGQSLTVNGKTFRFVGFNLYSAADQYPGGYYCDWPVWSDGTSAKLDTEFKAIKFQTGATVIRFWAFQSFTDGGSDWSQLDRVIQAAKNNDMYVLPTLENMHEHCTVGGKKYGWFGQAISADYKYGYPLSFIDYVKKIVTRYKDEPTVLAWMIMNEAEDYDRDALYNFAQKLSQVIKSIDQNHLVTFGATSYHRPPGLDLENYRRIHALSTIDFIASHDWSWYDNKNSEALYDSQDGSIPSLSQCANNVTPACGMAVAQALGKPFVITEAGWGAGSQYGYTVSQRANILGAKMDAAFNHDVDGYLIWTWKTGGNYGGFDMAENDPLFYKLQHYSQLFANTAASSPSFTSPTATPASTATSAPLPLPGDANADTAIDGIDYMIWKSHYNSSTTAGPAAGDFNSDQTVDGIDYMIWKSHYS